MDNKFTKKRIANMLSYDWIKMVIIVVAIVLVWVLAYTIGAPRATVGQTFHLFYYRTSGSFSTSLSPDDMLEQMQKEKVFSYDVLDFGSRDMSEDMYAEIMMTSTTVQEGDVMVTIEKTGEDQTSEMRTVIDGYGEIFYDYDTLILDAKQYCLLNNFVQLNGDNEYTLNTQKITQYFASRMSKDPRFKDKESERYKQGVQDEILRIKNVWNNAIMLEDCLENHPELRVNYVRYTQTITQYPNEYTDEGYFNQPELTYGINLGMLTGGKVSITAEFARNILNEDGEIESVTADGIVLLVYNYKSFQEDLQYESISVVNYFISRYSNFLNDQLPTLIK